MILKSSGRTSASYGQLIDYISRSGSAMVGEDGQPFLIKHNLEGKTLQEMVDEYMENEKNRAYQTKGVNKLYHEILSWAVGDREKLNKEKIEVIVRQYVRLRNENALFVAAIHDDRDAIHAHLCVSGTEKYSGQSLRVSKARHMQIKLQLQAFEQAMFPELTASVVVHDKNNKYRKLDREYQYEERTGNISKREEIRRRLEEYFTEAASREGFVQKIQDEGLGLYERGKSSGVVDGDRHYRFKTLGFGQERMKELEDRGERLQALEVLRTPEVVELKQEPERGSFDIVQQRMPQVKVEKKVKNVDVGIDR